MSQKLDTSRSFAKIITANPTGQKHFFEQDGLYFDAHGKKSGETASYLKAKEEGVGQSIHSAIPANLPQTREARATAALGDLGVDAHAEARKENQAAVQAETHSDDA